MKVVSPPVNTGISQLFGGAILLTAGLIMGGELSGLFIIKFAEPVFACIFGAILLGENIWRIQYLVAFIMISGSIWIASSGSPREHS